jgi:hypothetical protein
VSLVLLLPLLSNLRECKITAIRTEAPDRWQLTAEIVPPASLVVYQQEIETMIRQMKIEGGTLDECVAELKLL